MAGDPQADKHNPTEIEMNTVQPLFGGFRIKNLPPAFTEDWHVIPAKQIDNTAQKVSENLR